MNNATVLHLQCCYTQNQPRRCAVLPVLFPLFKSDNTLQDDLATQKSLSRLHILFKTVHCIDRSLSRITGLGWDNFQLFVERRIWVSRQLRVLGVSGKIKNYLTTLLSRRQPIYIQTKYSLVCLTTVMDLPPDQESSSNHSTVSRLQFWRRRQISRKTNVGLNFYPADSYTAAVMQQ